MARRNADTLRTDNAAGVREFAGIDHWSAMGNGCIAALLGLLAWFAAPSSIASYTLCVAIVALAGSIATRYRLRISTEGIEWVTLIAWFLPLQRVRYLLDAKIDLYESLDASEPEGVNVDPVRGRGPEEPSPCFGPSFDQASIASLHERANEAILHARELLPPTPFELRCPLLANDRAKLDIDGAKRDGQNRLREVKVTSDLAIGRLSLPAGTILELNGENYLDPRRHDRLVAAVINSTVRLPIGIDAPPDTRISLGPSGEVTAIHGPLGLVELDGFPIDGNQAIGLDAGGHVDSFTLGRAIELGGWALGAGTTFSAWPNIFGRGPSWYCTLSDAMRLPELELSPGDAVIFDKATGTLVQLSPRGERIVDGERFPEGSIPVHPSGRIDRKRARKMGVLAR